VMGVDIGSGTEVFVVLPQHGVVVEQSGVGHVPTPGVGSVRAGRPPAGPPAHSASGGLGDAVQRDVVDLLDVPLPVGVVLKGQCDDDLAVVVADRAAGVQQRAGRIDGLDARADTGLV